MKRHYKTLIDIEKGNFTICAFVCNRFQGFGALLSLDMTLKGILTMFEINLFWFRFYMTYRRN